MVNLYRKDIKKNEVLDWQGVHLFRFVGSSCSQKARIVLNLKGVDWESHPLNFLKAENYTPWYLGINPRGLMPTLVQDGDVHIESNGIISYLDEASTTPRLIPDNQNLQVQAHLQDEDRLHFDLRTLAFGFVLARFLAGKPPEQASASANRFKAAFTDL